MEKLAVLILCALTTPFLASGQAPKPGYGDVGCSEKDLFVEKVNVSADDFIEVHQIHCFTKCPLYTVRVYGDGRIAWHGDKAVAFIGDAASRVSAEQAQSLIMSARKLGFGALCDTYVMRAFDGSASSTSLRIGDAVKIVSNQAPSNAPSWLYGLEKQIADLDTVRGLIGPEQNPPRSHP